MFFIRWRDFTAWLALRGNQNNCGTRNITFSAPPVKSDISLALALALEAEETREEKGVAEQAMPMVPLFPLSAI